MIKPNISNKTKNILGIDCVEQFMQRRNVEVSLSYHDIVVTFEEHMSSGAEDILFLRNIDEKYSAH